MTTRLTAQKMDKQEIEQNYTSNALHSVTNGSAPTVQISQQNLSNLQQIIRQRNNNIRTSSAKLTSFVQNYNNYTRKDLDTDKLVDNLSVLNSTKDGSKLIKDLSVKFDENNPEDFNREDIKNLSRLFLKYCN